VPVADRTRDRAHGRVELRTLKAVTVNHFGFPHAAQVLQVTRKTREVGTRRWRLVVVYAITSLAYAQPRPARRPGAGALGDRERPALGAGCDLRRGRLQLRTGTGPQVMACLRNLVIGALSRAGPVNLAGALRHHARDPRRPLASLGITLE
jgi:hypothetical protein